MLRRRQPPNVYGIECAVDLPNEPALGALLVTELTKYLLLARGQMPGPFDQIERLAAVRRANSVMKMRTTPRRHD